MGVATEDGRLRDASVRAERPLYTLGAARRGELWETTAIPEIRVQAQDIALSLLTPHTRPAPQRARRPVDQFGLPLSTHGAAAAAFRKGLNQVITVRGGSAEAFERATELDRGFAMGHAALALLGHECGEEVDVPRALADAQRSVTERGDERERSFVRAVTRRIKGADDKAVIDHLGQYPGDALALSVAVPTIAFSGVSCLEDDVAFRLLKETAPTYDGHWFHTSLYAFVRQEQGHHEEAGELALRALAEEPGSGNAAHALAHVNYESGAHDKGREWLDQWIAGRGCGAVHRAHFSWHAALHELALDDSSTVRRRWYSQLAPGRVSGVRVLVDSGSMLWRARMCHHWSGRLPVDDVLDAVPREVIESPSSAFAALHSAVACAAGGDLPALRRLRTHAQQADEIQREVVVPLCDALEAVVEERWDAAVRGLRRVLPSLGKIGGSAAQREVIEETLLYAMVGAGHSEDARQLLEKRLDRRSSPLDARRLSTLPVPTVELQDA
ncbi:hypothetical protein [Streptomyces sp. NPDC088725]|uniref:tetratricopeptide repeat protein n=1 Tax=Streptomyces sp. NPDC088725 TaxID=3365873 RepID=UPI003817B1F9